MIIPNLKPDVLSKIESDFGTTIAKHLWTKVIQYQEWFNKSIPIGYIMPFYGAQEYATGGLITGPDSSYWLWCDGQTVLNANSPLNGQLTPNLKEIFLKGNVNPGLFGGQYSINLRHDHGGATGFETDNGSPIADNGIDHDNGTPHHHYIAPDWNTNESVIPPYLETQFYLRIDGGIPFSGPSKETTFGTFINSDLSKFGKILSQELATQLYQNINALDSIIPIGGIAPILINIAGVELPNNNIWQECDGSEIINENSPLRSTGGTVRTTPNLIDRYLRVPATFGLSGGYGGDNEKDFKHNHSGHTGSHYNPSGDVDNGSIPEGRPVHNHTISNDLSLINTEPPFYTVKFYQRIQ